MAEAMELPWQPGDPMEGERHHPQRMPRYRPRSTLGRLENLEPPARRRGAVQGVHEEVEAGNIRLMHMWRSSNHGAHHELQPGPTVYWR